MSLIEDARAATADAFAAHAETVTIDVGGVAVEALAIRLAPSEETEFATRTVTAETVVLRMLTSEVAPDGLGLAIVGSGASITLADGEARIAQGAPAWADPLRLTVAVDTRPAG